MKAGDESLFARIAPFVVLSAAVLNHALAFLSYEWNPGTDNYSYDAAGLQLVTGRFFDLFPVFYRPPLIPMLKNLLYLVFEGHPYLFGIFLHGLGVWTAWLVWRMGRRLCPAAGFLAGMFFALDLRMGVVFHAFSTETLYLPLLVWSAAGFFDWLGADCDRSAAARLVLATFLCALVRTEIVVLVPLYAFFGALHLRDWKRPLMVFVVLALLVNGLCFAYWRAFGYWGLTNKAGWSMFIRVSRKTDDIFHLSAGPATSALYGCMQDWCPWDFSADELEDAAVLSVRANADNVPERLRPMLGFPLLERQMYTLNAAQERYGMVGADRLFRRAVAEAAGRARTRYWSSSLVRFFCSLHLWDDAGLRHKEYMLSRARFLYTYVDRDYEDVADCDKWLILDWSAEKYGIFNPLGWERGQLIDRLAGRPARPLPEEFMLRLNYELLPGGAVSRMSRGDGVMAERLRHCLALDLYFHYYFWGPRFDKAYITRGKQLFDQRRFAEAEGMFRNAASLDPFNPQTLVDLANSVREQEREREADELCLRAASVGRVNSQAYIELGISAHNRGDFARAQKMFESALEIHPHRPEIFLESGHAYLEEGRTEQARGRFGRAIELEGEKDYSLAALGLCARSEGRDEEAARLFGRALELNGENFTALVELADMAQSGGDSEAASGFFLRALKLEPEEESCREGLISCGMGRDEVASIAGRAVRDNQKKREEERVVQEKAYNVSFVLEPVSRVKAGLRVLRFWDGRVFPLERHARAVFAVAWILWLCGLVFGAGRRERFWSGAMCALVLVQAALQSLFSDNYGGRFGLTVLPFYWVCAFYGLCALAARLADLIGGLRRGR